MNGLELKALRKQLGISTTKAAAQVEVSARTWQRWEAGKQNIPGGVAKLLSTRARQVAFLLATGAKSEEEDGK